MNYHQHQIYKIINSEDSARSVGVALQMRADSIPIGSALLVSASVILTQSDRNPCCQLHWKSICPNKKVNHIRAEGNCQSKFWIVSQNMDVVPIYVLVQCTWQNYCYFIRSEERVQHKIKLCTRHGGKLRIFLRRKIPIFLHRKNMRSIARKYKKK
jgi:hypothetical protein